VSQPRLAIELRSTYALALAQRGPQVVLCWDEASFNLLRQPDVAARVELIVFDE